MKISSISIVFFVFWLGIGCVKTDHYSEPDYLSLEKQQQQKAEAFDGKVISYAQLKSQATAEIKQYKENDAFEGYVISSDEAGNVYKKIYIQAVDKSGVITLIINKKGLYGDFKIGEKVQLRLKGNSFWISYNTLEVGYGVAFSSTGRKRMGYLPESMVENVLLKTGEKKPIEEIVTPFEKFSDLKKSTYLNRLVVVKDVQFSATDWGKTFYNKTDTYSTLRTLEDAFGGQLSFATSSFASYINQIVPEGKYNITGILTQQGAEFQLQINQISDLQKIN